MLKYTLGESVKQLKQVIELTQKLFKAGVLVDTIEDKEAQEELKKLMLNLRQTILFSSFDPFQIVLLLLSCLSIVLIIYHGFDFYLSNSSEYDYWPLLMEEQF